MKIIGLAGKARTGKDTVSLHLVKNYGFKQFSFAEHLKQVAEVAGWDGLKDERGRRLLQNMGDVLREYDSKIFIKQLIGRIKYYEKFCLETGIECRIVISDIRLIQEIEALKDLNASIWFIHRTVNYNGTVPAHATESLTDSSWKFDYVFDNNGTFEELYDGVDSTVKDILNVGC